MIVKPKQFVKPEEILFLTAVHGDEAIGVEVMRNLKNRFPALNWLIADEKALAQGIRFTDVDLNRVAPGDKRATVYEVRRAQEILEIAERYRCVIDIHSTAADTGIFTIVTNPTEANLRLAAALPIDRTVIWESENQRETGPITRFVSCGIEIECGPKNNPEIKQQLQAIIEIIARDGLNMETISAKPQQRFRVRGKIRKKNTPSQQLRDFEMTEIDSEKFYPLLSGQYSDILCYKMYVET